MSDSSVDRYVRRSIDAWRPASGSRSGFAISLTVLTLISAITTTGMPDRERTLEGRNFFE